MKRFLFGLILLIFIVVVAYVFFKPPLEDTRIGALIESVPGIETLNEFVDKAKNLTSEKSSVQVGIDTDPDTPEEMVAVGEAGEALVAFAERRGDEAWIDEVALVAPDGTSGLISVGENGLVKSFASQGYLFEYANHTDEGVDITITGPDGEVTTVVQEPVTAMPTEVARGNGPWAQAQLNSGPGSVRYAQPHYASVPTDEHFSAWEVISQTTFLANIVGCGASVAALLPTFGGSASIGLLSCGTVLVRTGINFTELDQCMTEEQRQAKDFSCIVDGFEDGLRRVTGPQVDTFVRSAKDGRPVEKASVVRSTSTGRFLGRNRTNDQGYAWVGDFTEQGSYLITVGAEGYQPVRITVAVTADRIKAVDADSGTVYLDEAYTYEGKFIYMRLKDVRLSPESSARFDGAWAGTATTSIFEVPDPTEPGETIECADATFSWDIKDSAITGSALVDQDYTIKLQGSVDPQGTIEAGSGFSFIEQVTFTGTLSEGTGAGDWKASSGCIGTWKASKTP